MFIYILDLFAYNLSFPLLLSNFFANFNLIKYLFYENENTLYICILFSTLIKSFWDIAEKWGDRCYRCFIEANNEANTIIIPAR